MFKKIKKAAKRWFHKVSGNTTILEALGTSPVTSNKMREAIALWSKMYEGKGDWIHPATEDEPLEVISLGLPSAIASEKARMATLELKSEITAIDKKDDKRAAYLNKAYQTGVIKEIRKQAEYAIAKGGLAITPYVVYVNGKPHHFAFDYTQAERFIPLEFDTSGKIVDAAFLITKETPEYIYYRLERQTYSAGVLTITNRAYKREINAPNKSAVDIYDIILGDEIRLSEVPEWAELAQKVIYKNVDRVFFAYIKMPQANTIDTDSPLGVSGYSRAVNLIKQADIQHARLDLEYNIAQIAVDVDSEAFPDTQLPDGTVVSKFPQGYQRVFRKRDTGDPTTYDVYAPNLRDESYLKGLDNIKVEIEDTCALSRGVFSRSSDQARTATELKILRQRTYSENASIQNAIQSALEDVVYIMEAYASILHLVDNENYTGNQRCQVSFEFDDSIIVDREVELQQRLNLMHNGLAGRIENRMWYYGETEGQAIKALRKIDAENSALASNHLENIGEI